MQDNENFLRHNLECIHLAHSSAVSRPEWKGFEDRLIGTVLLAECVSQAKQRTVLDAVRSQARWPGQLREPSRYLASLQAAGP